MCVCVSVCVSVCENIELGSLALNKRKKKVLMKFKFAGITSSGTLCTCVSGSVAVLSLEVPDQSCGFANLQLAVCGAKLAICRAHVVGCQVEPRALLHALRYYAL